MSNSDFHRLCQSFSRYLVNPDETPDSAIWDHLDICKKCQDRLLEFDGKESPSAFDEHYQSELALAREVLRSEIVLADDPPDELLHPETSAPSEAIIPEVPGFDLLEIIGKGSTGVVWKAVQQDLNRIVALKILQNDSASFQDRLKKEAKILASLQHPHLLTIYAFGSWNGKAWMALEFCPGGSLYRRNDQPWDPRQAANLVRQVALGAQAAHEKGIIHRDIKPGNILLGLDGLPRLADFDLARNPLAAQEPPVAGEVAGTPAYIAPEQALGKEIDCRADVHGLGSVLYYLLTGRPPFRADSRCEVLLLAAYADPAATIKSRPSVPHDLDRICQKCLAKDPLGRYQTAAELAEDLARFLMNKPVRARPLSVFGTSWRWAKRNQALAITGAVGLVATALMVIASTILLYIAAALASPKDSPVAGGAKSSAENEKPPSDQSNNQKIEASKGPNRALGTEYREHIKQANLAWENGASKVAQNHLDQCAFNQRGWEHNLLHARLNGNQYNLEGHTDAVLAVSLSRDGRLVASGGKDRRVVIRELATGRILHNYENHASSVNSIAFGPNSNLVASGSDDTTVHIWEPVTGHHFVTLQTDGTQVLALAFHPDGERLFATTAKGNCFIWNAQTGSLIKSLKVDDLAVRALALDSEGMRLAMGGDGGKLFLYDPRSHGLLAAGPGKGPILSLDFSPDGKRIVSGNQDEKESISTWDASTGALLKSFQGHQGSVTKALFTPDGGRIVSGSHDRRILIWDAFSGAVLEEVKGHIDAISCAAIHANGTLFVTSGLGRSVKIRNLNHPYFPVYKANGKDHEINCFKERSGQGQLIAGTRKGEILFLDQRYLTLQKSIAAHAGPILSLDIAPDGTHAATGSTDKVSKIWDLSTGKAVATLAGHEGPIARILFDSTRKRAITAGSDETIRIWDSMTGQTVGRFEKHQAKVNTMAIDSGPGGTRVISGDESGTVMAWDLESRVLSRVLHFEHAIKELALSPNRECLLVASANNQLFSVKMKGDFKIVPITNHHTSIHHIAVSKDDKRFVTADGDSKIRVWDAETNDVVLVIDDHGAAVKQASFSSDGQTLISCAADGTIRGFSAQIKDPWFLIPDSAKPLAGNPSWQARASDSGAISYGFSRDSKRLIQMDRFGHRISTDVLTGIQKAEHGDDMIPLRSPDEGMSSDNRWLVKGDENGIWLGNVESIDLLAPHRQRDLALWTQGAKKLKAAPLKAQSVLLPQRIGQGSIWSAGTGVSFPNRYAFAALKEDGSVVTWGDPIRGGDSSAVANNLQSGVIHLYCNSDAFAALKRDGSVVAWGHPECGGNSSSVADQLKSGVVQIYSTSNAFAALKADGSLVTWGHYALGGNSFQVKEQLRSGVVEVFSNGGAFAARKANGGLLTWGDSRQGGVCSAVADRLSSGVARVFGTGYAFAALKQDGSVVTWGDAHHGGDSSEVAHYLKSGVVNIASTVRSFAALKEDGSVVSWSNHAGKHWPVARKLNSGVVDLFAGGSSFAAVKYDGAAVSWGDLDIHAPGIKSDPDLHSGAGVISSNVGAFAALKTDGTITTWGYGPYGEDTSLVPSQLRAGVLSITATSRAFAALKKYGAVVTWGSTASGGDQRSVASKLTSNIKAIYPAYDAFAALKEDGSVVTWGDPLTGGDSSRVAKQLASGVVALASVTVQSPWFVSPSQVEIEVGKACQHKFEARGLPMTMTYRIVSGRLPEGITLDSRSGTLLGEPTSSFRGAHSIKVEASNGVGKPAVQAMVLSVR